MGMQDWNLGKNHCICAEPKLEIRANWELFNNVLDKDLVDAELQRCPGGRLLPFEVVDRVPGCSRRGSCEYALTHAHTIQ